MLNCIFCGGARFWTQYPLVGPEMRWVEGRIMPQPRYTPPEEEGGMGGWRDWEGGRKEGRLHLGQEEDEGFRTW